MTIKTAKDICRENFVGPDELARLPWLKVEKSAVSEIPFSESLLRTHAGSHILVLTPRTPHLTVCWLRERFGVDPLHEPCMYNQDWYMKETFANTPMDGTWHLIQKTVRNVEALLPANAMTVAVGAKR